MKRSNKGGRRIAPQPGGESFQIGESGPPVYHIPPSEKVTIVKPVPLDEWQTGEVGPPLSAEDEKAHRERHYLLDATRPLVPTAEEVTRLPAAARTAFAARCAARVAGLATPAPTELDPAVAASWMVAAATVESPVRRWLRCLRRDFDRLVFLAKKHGWTDDTPVPPEVFGPLWPADCTPPWARETGRR